MTKVKALASLMLMRTINENIIMTEAIINNKMIVKVNYYE